MRKSGARQRGRLFFCDTVRYGIGDMSNYCLSAVSWSIVQLQWESYKYYRGRYNLHVSHKDRGSIWLPKPPGDCFRTEYFFSLRLAFSSALSLVSINSTAALSPPLAALPSQCPTPSSFPSVYRDPWGPRLPPWSQTWSNINQYLCRAALVSGFLRTHQSQVTFLGKFWEWTLWWEMGFKWLSVVLHVLAH